MICWENSGPGINVDATLPEHRCRQSTLPHGNGTPRWTMPQRHITKTAPEWPEERGELKASTWPSNSQDPAH